MTATAHDQAARLRQLFAGAGIADEMRAAAQQASMSRVALVPPQVGPTVPLVTIASGKGGVGKTSLAVNLAISLGTLGCRTTLLDADIGTANADVLCGISPRHRLDELLRRDAGVHRSAEDIAVSAPGGFLLVPGAVGIPHLHQLEPADRDRVLDRLVALEARTDLFLIDAGAGVGPDVLSFVEAADAVLLVITPEPTSIADAYALLKSVRQRAGASRLSWWVVVNAAAHEAEAVAAHARLATCAQRFLSLRLPLMGWVHADRVIAQAVRKRRPFALHAKRSRSAREVRTLARSVMGLTEWIVRRS